MFGATFATNAGYGVGLTTTHDKKFAPHVVLPTGESCRVAADAIESDVVWTVGSITLALAAVAASTVRETYRIPLDDLGRKDTSPVPKDEYDRIRREGMNTTV